MPCRLVLWVAAVSNRVCPRRVGVPTAQPLLRALTARMAALTLPCLPSSSFHRFVPSGDRGLSTARWNVSRRNAPCSNRREPGTATCT